MVELTWDGKYDKDGRKAAPLRLKLPFQTVETVNESAQQRQLALDLFSAGRPSEWRNRLVWGDKKYVLPALLDEFAGQVDLIYIDPPFNVGADFSFQVTIEDENFTKQPNIIEQKAYRDTWGRGLDSYLHWFYETVVLLFDLLSEQGTLYVHLDYRTSHFAKVVLDQVFGMKNFLNEVIWAYRERGISKNCWNRKHDVILVYVKNIDSQIFNFQDVLEPYTEDYLAKFKYQDEKGRYQIRGRNIVGSPVRQADGLTPEAEEKYPDLTYRQYMREGTLPLDWWEISLLNKAAHERTDYPTQKPEKLLEKILKASSNEGSLVLDCFCGSGTTAAVAEKLNRRWIACDLGRFAIHTTRKRLLSIDNVRPFVVQNLGKYERQAWQAAEFGGPEQAAQVVAHYRRFILELYNARPIEGYTWLHGLKQGRMVHIGPVDSPISPGDVQQIALEFRKAVGTGKDAPSQAAVDVLGWDFAFD
jgi:DNA modification methylase